MTVVGHRRERIAEEIREEISAMLTGELKDPRLTSFSTVTEVRVAPGLKQVRVYVSVLGSESEQKATLAGLQSAGGFIRHELTERLRMRRAPEIIFVLDHSEEYGSRIDELLRRAREAT